MPLEQRTREANPLQVFKGAEQIKRAGWAELEGADPSEQGPSDHAGECRAQGDLEEDQQLGGSALGHERIVGQAS